MRLCHGYARSSGSFCFERILAKPNFKPTILNIPSNHNPLFHKQGTPALTWKDSMSAGLYAIQHIRRMRGGSQAHLLRASDGAFYVTKFQNNPQHLRVLANEMFASRLGQWLGLPVPRVEVIEVSDWLITHTQDLRVEMGVGAVPYSSGKQLASLYPQLEAQVFDYLPEPILSRVANLADFARSLVLERRDDLVQVARDLLVHLGDAGMARGFGG